jgi:hypothetical protein
LLVDLVRLLAAVFAEASVDPEQATAKAQESEGPQAPSLQLEL